MPRNASGIYSLPAGNPVVTQTTIATTWGNTTLDDLKAEMTDSLSRSGKGAMLAPLQLTDGTAALPSLTFALEANSGFFRAAAGDVRFVVQALDRVQFVAAGATTITGRQAAASAGTDVVLQSAVGRTAGDVLLVQSGLGGDILRLEWDGTMNLPNKAVILTRTTNLALTLKGNKSAADVGTDIVLTSSATRTAGFLLDLQNNGVSQLRVQADGSVRLEAIGTISALSGNATLTLRGNKNAADAGADVVVTSVATRTAGLLLDVQNNAASRFQVLYDGTLRFPNAAFLDVSAANTGITLRGNRAAADAFSEVVINGQATRTAGLLLDLQNNSTAKARVDFAGVVQAPNVQQVSASTANDIVTGTTMQSVAGLSFPVAANSNYEAEFFLLANTSGTGVHNVQLTGPAAPTAVSIGGQGIFGTTANGFGAAAFSTPFQVEPGSIANATWVSVKMFLRNGANAGTVQLQHASGTAGQNAGIFADSHVRWARIDNAGLP